MRVIALGFFDGIHLGHKALIDKANEIAKKEKCLSSVFTFTNHPDEVVFGEKVPFLVEESRREKQIKDIGKCDEVIFWDFNETSSKLGWEEFIKDVLMKYKPIHIVTGEDFRFGYKGLGNSVKLAKLCKELGISYSAIPQVKVAGERVSSTIIRKHLSNGEITKANILLGHNYEITGKVIHGRKQGRVIGFNTANVKMPISMQTLPNGVYKTKTKVFGEIYESITNVGVIPSFRDTTEILVETHIFDFNQDIYDEEISVYVIDFIRAERKFAGIEEIKMQIQKDIEICKPPY